MKTFITGFFVVCSFVRLSFGVPHHAHDHTQASPNDTYTITLHIYSGTEKSPVWTIPRAGQEDPKRVEKIIELINWVGHEQDSKPKTGVKTKAELNELRPRNGYQGLTVEHFDAKGNSLHAWTMPACTHPTLEWNLVIITAENSVVSLEKKFVVHKAISKCTSNTTTKKPATSV